MPEMFKTSYGLQIGVKEIVAEVLAFMCVKPGATYKIIIGSDSELLENKTADFVTAIVIHRIGNGGRYFWRRSKLGKFYNLHDRIVQEVMLSLDTAKIFFADFKNALAEQDPGNTLRWSFEIHIDAGENGPTRTLIQEVVGMVRASNFEPKTKPESYAASNVADRYV